MENNIKIDLQSSWKFCLGDAKRWNRVDHNICYATCKAGQELGDLDVFLKQNNWESIDLPHDWNTKQSAAEDNYPSNGFKPRGTGWYYKEFVLPEYLPDATVLLEFEGIMGESVVYVNGIIAARNETGYTGFTTDISDFVLPGEKNWIAVSVDNTRWEGWWYEGAGIYRPVSLFIKPGVHFTNHGLFLKPVLNDGVWKLCLDAEIENTTPVQTDVKLSAKITDPDGNTVLTLHADGATEPYSKNHVDMEGVLSNAILWSPDSPSLYKAELSLNYNGILQETENISFGVRDIQWTDHGMFINGIKTPVRGICCHQDHVGVGIAVTKSLIRYRVAKLKAMGCNAYRCAHNCPSDYLLQVCDELGMLVMAENRHYRSTEEVLRQIDELTRLSRNHPSVFLYSLFNEEPWQAENRGRRMAEKMLRRVRENDDSRPVTAAMNGGMLTRENASDVLDVAGINYFIYDYMNYADRRPGHPMVGTENGPLYATRGIYQSNSIEQIYDSYGLNTAPFGQRLQETMEQVEAAPQVAGLFVWGGFDYRGEPQPFEWPSVFSHWGLTDNCGFEKDTFYMLKSYYSDKDTYMLHILPHWNWNEGEDVRVCAMTNCETAQLFVNGEAQEEKAVVRNRAEWVVPFHAGDIRVIARGGDRILEEKIETVGEATQLFVRDASSDIDYDSSIMNITVVDELGREVPGRACDRTVSVEVIKGTLLGAGNGDPNGIQPDVTSEIKTFCGKCQFIIAPDQSGAVQAIFHAEGLPNVEYRNKKEN